MQPETRSRRGVGGRPKTGKPNPIDVHVGSRVRLRRTLLGMSQEKLGEAIGLTFQQVQKYERGANRIGASRLFDLSRVLDVPVSFFFDDMPSSEDVSQAAQASGYPEVERQAGFEPDPMAKRETLELVRAYYRISDPHVRKRIFELTKSVANAAQTPAG
ncbi:MAG TPA: helix-turn-helix domain-containing protein [Arenibaculum sp.]|nr:helix-turn-helix domain-containing protein [Arenibaculum sp.]